MRFVFLALVLLGCARAPAPVPADSGAVELLQDLQQLPDDTTQVAADVTLASDASQATATVAP